MDKVSEVIFDKSSSERISSMVKAMQGWETSLADSMDKPSGQFGRVVKIETNGLTMTNDLDLEFDVPFDDDTEANETEIRV